MAAVPVQVTFRDIGPSEALRFHAEKRARKLETFFDRLLRCHVVLEAPHRHHKHGKRYHVRIDMAVPGKELVVSRNTEDNKEDMHAAIDDAFADAERVLEEYARQLQDTRHRESPPVGVVSKLFVDRGYGFLETRDGHEVYFHKNSVLGKPFERLKVGTKVRFAEEDGDKGPQASTVHVVD